MLDKPIKYGQCIRNTRFFRQLSFKLLINMYKGNDKQLEK